MPRYPGGLIRKTPVTPTGPFQNGTASGVWSLADASYWLKQGLWPTAGNFLVVEDVFSTYLYTGTGAAQTITNEIDLAGKGGLVWLKERTANYTDGHWFVDTSRGVNSVVKSNTTAAQATIVNSITAFNSTGFSIGSNASFASTNYASWTFREAPKFFDVVTWTGNGVSGRQIAHNLGVAPGMIIVKSTTRAENWTVYHQSLGNTGRIPLNTTDAAVTGSGIWASTTPTATNFTVSADNLVNFSGDGYVAYLYAHDTASDGIIQCGSFTTDGSGAATVNLGYEPQWLMAKCSSLGGPWVMADIMRGMTASGVDATLLANTTAAEGTSTIYAPTATGFTATNLNGSATYIYMAIRRGPMKTPTLGTSVFAPVAQTGGGTVTTNFPVDMAIYGTRSSGTNNHQVTDRLRGAPFWVTTNLSNAEAQPLGAGVALLGINNSNVGYTDNVIGAAAAAYWSFRRAPGFMDVVCYTGTGVLGRTVAHNLGVAPEFMIIKRRNSANDWGTYHSALGNTKLTYLNYNLAPFTAINWWNNTTPTASVFTVGDQNENNSSGSTYVGYLFASCPGVSKVGSYTGNGSSQTINCAFTTGSRFVMIKRTDSTGDWYVWDSARGIVAGNDPYLALNTAAAEVTTNDSVDTDNTGFIVNQVAASNVNVNGATYIFLAIA